MAECWECFFGRTCVRRLSCACTTACVHLSNVFFDRDLSVLTPLPSPSLPLVGVYRSSNQAYHDYHAFLLLPAFTFGMCCFKDT